MRNEGIARWLGAPIQHLAMGEAPSNRTLGGRRRPMLHVTPFSEDEIDISESAGLREHRASTTLL